MNKTLSREELIDLVEGIKDPRGTEDDTNRELALLEANVPDPNVSDLIFWPDGPELTAEEVVDKALAYQAIPLGRSSQED